MAVCTRCGGDTQLYYHHVAICLRCSDALEREIQRRDLQILSTQLATDWATYPEDLKVVGAALVIGAGQFQAPDYLKQSR